jgi:nitronate monooxygenase
MFLVSGPDLVVETCRSGIVGTFPALNQKTSEGYAAWLDEIELRLAARIATRAAAAPFGVNLIVHKTNARLASDVEITVRHHVPIVITFAYLATAGAEGKHENLSARAEGYSTDRKR